MDRNAYQLPLTGVTPDQYQKYKISQDCAVTGWYFDLTQPPIAKQPIYGVRNNESQIPNIMTKDYPSPIAGRDATCSQPVWSPNCV